MYENYHPQSGLCETRLIPNGLFPLSVAILGMDAAPKQYLETTRFWHQYLDSGRNRTWANVPPGVLAYKMNN